MKLDLNAKRAARAAKVGDAMQIELGDQTFDLVTELPIDIGELAFEGKLAEAFRAMLANPEADWERLRACRPSFNDVLDVVEFYGTTLGESLRSSGNLPTTGQPSKPISTATTAAISPPPATDPIASMYDASSDSSDTFPQAAPTGAS